MNKKGITPIIAVVLLLMMTVAAAGAAFYWLTRMQQQAQSGVTGQQQKLIEDASAGISLVSQRYSSGTSDLLLDVQNTGGKSISLTNSSIIAILEDGDGQSVCSSGNLDSSNFMCDEFQGCNSSDDLAPNEVTRLNISIDSTACSMTSGTTYYYQLNFDKGSSLSGSFEA